MARQTPFILIVDDEDMLRSIAVQSFQFENISVLEARNGSDALDIFAQHRNICLLISDVRMPGMDGYELCSRVLEMNPNVHIVIMTGYSADPPPALLQRRNVFFLQKPFDLDLLVAHARKAMCDFKGSGG